MNTCTQTVSTDLPETIDWTVLAGLRELQMEGEPDFAQEMMDMFLSSTPALLTTIEQAVAQGDAGALGHAAHTLKSNSKGLGAIPMGMLCAELEKKGRSGCMDSAADMLTELEREYERVKTAFESPR